MEGVKNMNKEKWLRIAPEIAEHLMALRKIAKENNMESLDIAVFSDSFSFATHIDSKSGTHWGIDIQPDGSVVPTVNCSRIEE